MTTNQLILCCALMSFAMSLGTASTMPSLNAHPLSAKPQDDSATAEKKQSGATATDASECSPTFGDPIYFRWKAGVKIKGGNQACQNLIVTIPVPNDWPEQEVTVYEQNIPLQSREYKFRDLPGGLRQMIATLPFIRANQEIEYEMIYAIRVTPILRPKETASLAIPKRVVHEMKMYLDASPNIDFRNSKLRNLVKEITADKETAWEQVQSFYQWICDNIEATEDLSTNSINCFNDRKGGPEDIVGLFVGMCRIKKIPARTVWADGSQYAEFYLEDGDGNGYWYPVVLTGLQEFGSLSEPRIIQQKGDNLRVPEKKGDQQLVVEFVHGEGGAPSVEFIRELLPNGN